MYKIKCTNKKTGSIRHIRMEEDWRKTLLLDSLEEAEKIRDDADYDEEYLEWEENYGKLNPNEIWEIIEVKE